MPSGFGAVMWWASEESPYPAISPSTSAPRARAFSADSSTRIPAPSPRLKPLRSSSKGVEFPSGEIAPAALKIARVNRVVPASAPPTTAASASPSRILRTPAIIACAPEEHAVTIAVVSPCSPWRMEICAGAAFAIIMGTVSGETSSAPSVCITKCCVSSVSSPPIAVPI